MIPSICFAILFIVLAIVILIGKGDMLIAGYNTASKEERKRVNIKRLRLLIGILCFITAGFCLCLPFLGEDIIAELSAGGIFLLITFIFIILANTWAKMK